MRGPLLAATCFVVFFSGSDLWAQVRFGLVKSEIVQARLGQYKGSDREREATLLRTFAESGCPAAGLSEQLVSKHKAPNLICVLPGDGPEEIIVGAHFDHVSAGDGVVDNWSGASLLPSLFQSLLGSKHQRTFIFIAFTGEEEGEVGSNFYVKHLSKSELSKIKLMITIDSIGLGPTEVWVSRSDREAVGLLGAAAQSMKVPLGAVNVEGYGESDEEPFLRHGVKTVTVHSITKATMGVIHSALDTPSAISFRDYYDTYRLMACYLAVLDKEESIK